MKTSYEIATELMDNIAGAIAVLLYKTLNYNDIDKFTFENTSRIEEATKKLFENVCAEFGIDEIDEPEED